MPGPFESLMDELVALEGTFHPTLNVYRWWRPDMALPAVWNWLTPGDVEPVGVPACKVRDLMRITVSIGVDPTAVMGEGDMLELEAYADLATPLLNAAIYERNPLGVREAHRRGGQTVADELAGVPILALELPIEVYLDRVVQPTP